MKFKEWLRIDEATPGNRQTSPSGINLAIPTHYSTYGGSGEVGYYGRENPTLTAFAHVARGGLGKSLADSMDKSGHRVASAVGMEPLDLGDRKDEKIVAVGIPFQTSRKMGDGSDSIHKMGSNFSTVYTQTVRYFNDADFNNSILTLDDLGTGNTTSPKKFALADEKNLEEATHAEMFTRSIALIYAYQKIQEDPKVDEYDLNSMRVKDQKKENDVMWFWVQFEKSGVK